MIFRSCNNWTNIDTMRGLLYFAQRIEELTYPYSLDSYKSQTTSIRDLLNEFMELIEGAAQHEGRLQESLRRSAEHVHDEISYRLNGNWVASSCLSIEPDKFLNINLQGATTKEILKITNTIYADFDDELYLAEIVARVIDLAGSPREKTKLDFLAREFVATIQGRRVSREHINEAAASFFFGNNEIGSPEALKKFATLVYPHTHEFRVAVLADNGIKDVDEAVLARRKVFKIDEEQLRDSHKDLNEESKEVEQYLEKYRSEVYSQILGLHVRATDYKSAAAAAKGKIEGILAFYRVFSHRAALSISTEALVKQQCCENDIRAVPIPQNHMHFIRDMRSQRASSVMLRFDRRITLDMGSDRQKFANIIAIHGLSLQSDSSQIQLVNVWTCLETMAPPRSQATNITSVVASAVPALMLGYFNRLVVRLLFDILRWNRVALRNALKSAQVQSGYDLRENFVLLLCVKENEPALSSLLADCRDFELLRHRIYSISQLLTNRKAAKEKLESHERLIRWQLHRVYRARNSIVHKGVSPHYVSRLLENAHDFLDILLMFCMELSAWKSGFDTFETCFDYAESTYQKYMQGLQSLSANSLVWTLPRTKGKSFIFGEEAEAS